MNDRYKQFSKAAVFIAGDEEQFQSRRAYENASSSYDEKTASSYDGSFPEKYSCLSGSDVTNTFRYMFHKFKKGIYVRVKDNKVTHFLPFSKIKYVNEWSDRIRYDAKVFKKVSEDLGYRFNERGVNAFTNTWYSNNCLVRYEYPICENDTDLETYKSMFTVMCEKRVMPDMEFFVNRRDFPILKRTNTEPYNHIWDSEEKELVSHAYEKYVPIFSSSAIPSKFADVLFPTAEEWVRAMDGESESTIPFDSESTIPFDSKIPTAVFRGSSTGIGVTVETNPRLKVAYLSTHQPASETPLIDAGITKWKNRPRKLQGEKELKCIDIVSLPFGLVKSLTHTEQSAYKYIIHIKGYVSAYRLSYELNLGSVILIVDDPDGYQLWFSQFLVPYVHYIPVKSDMSDLFSQVEYCRNNNEKMKEIVVACKQFHAKYLTKDGLMNYITSMMHALKKHTGTYTYTPYSEKQYNYEKTQLANSGGLRKLNIPDGGVPDGSVPDGGVPDGGYVFYKNFNDGGYDRFYNKFRAVESTDILSSIKFVRNLEKTRNTVIDVFGVKNLEFVVKGSAGSDLVHEHFIGKFCINPLTKIIPNFLYTFGSIDDKRLVIEKIDGMNFRSWLDTRFEYNTFVHILAQINLALIVAQNACLFVHYDLFPWNVMLQFLDREIEVQYPIALGKIVVVKTRVVPIIIDYGNSTAISRDGIIHAGVKPFEFDEHHDMKTLIISSIKHLITRQQPPAIINKMVEMMRCYYPSVRGFSDLRRVCSEFSFSNSLIDCQDKMSPPNLGSHFAIQDSITKRFNAGDVNEFVKSFYGIAVVRERRIYAFSDEILTAYFSVFMPDSAVPSTVEKRLNVFSGKSFTVLTDEMLHTTALHTLAETVNTCKDIEYYEMLETIIYYGRTETRDYFWKKYSSFLQSSKLMLMNHVSVKNTILFYK